MLRFVHNHAVMSFVLRFLCVCGFDVYVFCCMVVLCDVLGSVVRESSHRVSGHEDRQVRIFSIPFWKSFGSLLSFVLDSVLKDMAYS